MSDKAKIIIPVVLVFFVIVGVGWVKNILKLTQCDFHAPVRVWSFRTITDYSFWE